MLARRVLPVGNFSSWNVRWGAPFGHSSLAPKLYRRAARRLPRLAAVPMKMAGPFGFQRNSPTRTYEYPWAFDFLRGRAEVFACP